MAMCIASLAMFWEHQWLWDKVWRDVTQLCRGHGEAQGYVDAAYMGEDAKPDEQ